MKLEVSADTKGEWRWRLLRSGRIIAGGAEGYSWRAGAIRAANNLSNELYDHPDIDVLEVCTAS